MSALTVSVQLRDGTWLTPPKVSGVQFVKTAPGGCASGQFTIDDGDWIDQLGPQCPVVFSESSTGRTVWSGFVKDDGRDRKGASTSMLVDVSGTAQCLTEVVDWLPYAVNDLGAWKQDTGATTNKSTAQAGSGTLPWHESIPALMMSMPQGQINPLDCLRLQFTGFDKSSMTLAGMTASVESGVTQGGSAQYPPNWTFTVFWGDPGWNNVPASWTSDKINYETDFSVSTGNSGAPAGQNILELEWKFQGANGKAVGYTSTSDSLWVGVWNPVIYGQCNDRHGNPVQFSPAALGGWEPRHIVEDLMSRLLAEWVHLDPALSRIDDSSTLSLNQFDFSGSSGPVNAQTVLDALTTLDPDFYYYVGAQQANGRAPLSWLPWPKTAKYQAPALNVVYDASGSAQELCNEVIILWTDESGVEQKGWLQADPSAIPDLAGLHRTRQAVIRLDKTAANSLQAEKVASSWFRQVSHLPKGATATITKPVMDLQSGSLVLPSMIEPGQLMLVPETGDQLRINEVDYDADKDTATVKLASPTLTLDQLIAGIGQKRSIGVSS